MKKDESPRVSSVKERGNAKTESKIQAPKTVKPFLGCDTCKLKNNVVARRNKINPDNQAKAKKICDANQNKKPKIKLTDLCEEDKKRIVELMEELSRFAEKNKSLKESIEFMEKTKQEQHDCLMKQTNLHLEEKNIFLKEIQTYKARLEVYENEMKEKLNKWESRERFMDSEIRYLVKSLQKSFNEKSDLMKEIGHLKTCLKQSLESFELLRNEVSTLRHLSMKSAKSATKMRCPSGGDKSEIVRGDESEDSQPSPPKEDPSNKNSLDVINNKLEQLYALLQNRNEMPDAPAVGSDAAAKEVEVKAMNNFAQEEKTAREPDPEKVVENGTGQNAIKGNAAHQEAGDTNYKFLKPFNEYDKTSIQAERILKNIEKPFNFECDEKLGNKTRNGLDEELTNFERRIHNLEEMSGGRSFRGPGRESLDEHLDEDRLLSDLFYSDAVANLGAESALLLVNGEKFTPADIYS